MSDALALVRLPFPAHVTQSYHHHWRCVGRDYLDKESEHKREHPFDFTGWENFAADCPQQVIWLVAFTLILLVVVCSTAYLGSCTLLVTLLANQKEIHLKKRTRF